MNLVLLAAGFILFLPEGWTPPPLKEVRRYGTRYGRYFVWGLSVLALHLVLVQLDPALTRRLAWEFAPTLAALEGDAVPAIASLWNPTLSLYFGIVVLIVHPVMMLFPILLYVVSEEERAAKAALLIYPLAYAMAVPFYLFFPATSVYIHHDLSSPLFELFPFLTDFYFNATTPNNSFPSFHVAVAILLANAARYSRNRRLRYFTYAYAASLVAGTLYLALNWVADVVGGIVVAAFVATLTARAINVERLALQRVKPEPEEAHAIQRAASTLVERAAERAAGLGFADARPMLVGSVAKDTFLRTKVDLDVFVLFSPSLSREELERRGLAVGRSVFPDGTEKYAEHPYVHGQWQGYDADLVPAYAVADPAKRMSAVDRTPFHTRLVLERMDRDQRDQVRLLKQFMIGTGVYGAESKVRGFSGYLAELLVLKFKTFRGVVRAGTKWKPGTFLLLETMEGSPRFHDPLVFIDPVDPRRNAASAVSAETLALFAEACRAFLHREGLNFFFPRQLVPLTPEDLERLVRRRRTEFLLVELERPEALEDHLHDQMRKAAAAIASLLERHEFEVKKWSYDLETKARLLLELARLRLPEAGVHAGPPVREADHAERFRKTWEGSPEALSGVYEEDGRLKVKRRREFRRADELVRARLRSLDLGKHVNKAAERGFEVVPGTDVVREETTTLLTRHVSRKKPWEQ